MPPADLSRSPVDRLGARYAAAAARHTRAVHAGQARTANRAFNVLVAVGRELRLRGPDGRAVLAELMAAADPSVRCWAAGEALFCAPRQAERVLRALCRGPLGVDRFNAEMTLGEWRAGRLKPSEAYDAPGGAPDRAAGPAR